MRFLLERYLNISTFMKGRAKLYLFLYNLKLYKNKVYYY